MFKFNKTIFLAVLFLGFFGLTHSVSAKTFYLDGNLSANCTSGNYSIANRNCSGTDGNAYSNIADAETNLVGGDTLYIRAGTYTRGSDTTRAILVVDVAGTAGHHTVVRGYSGEQPVLCHYGKCRYNPNPNEILHQGDITNITQTIAVGDIIKAETSGKKGPVWYAVPAGSTGHLIVDINQTDSAAWGTGYLNIVDASDNILVSHVAVLNLTNGNLTPGSCSVAPPAGTFGVGEGACYYPRPVIYVGKTYADIIGIKTYGMVVFKNAHYSTLQNSDIGGGGPGDFGSTTGQACAILVHSTHDAVIRNNKIHNSVRANDGLPGWGNGVALMTYGVPGAYAGGTFIIENNEWYDNNSGDIFLKDGIGSLANTIITIRNNFFKPSLVPTNGLGIKGTAQYAHYSELQIYNNIFLNKSYGTDWEFKPVDKSIIYNNTFINCGSDMWTGQITTANMEAYNNLFYNTIASQYYQDYPNVDFGITSDYNMYYTTASTRWRRSSSYTTLSAWKIGIRWTVCQDSILASIRWI